MLFRSSPLDTVLVVVSAKDGDPQVAAGIANAVARRLAVLIQDLETPLEEGNMSPVKASVVQTAIAPLAPTSPRPLLNLALGFLLGAAAGVGIALLRESLDVTLKSLDDVMAITGGNPIGVIPLDSEIDRTLTMSMSSRSPRSEGFRALRTNLQFVDVDNPPKVVVVSSSIAGDRKSTRLNSSHT